MRPIWFDGCFGWLHTPSDHCSAGIAVVICPGLATDGLTGYRPLRLLATALAKAGYPTLRFDYPGTGNSCNTGGIEHWQVWQESIHAAIQWLHDHGLAQRIVLCGLRAGAALAMEVSETRADVAGLLMLEPVLRGRSFIRQLSIEANMQALGPGSDGALAVHELQLSAQTVGRISQVDLRRSRPKPLCRIAVHAQSPSKLLSECVTVWGEAGAIVEVEGFAGLESTLRPTLMSHTASLDATSILSWLRRSLPATAFALAPATAFALAPPAAFALATAQLPAESTICAGAYSETPVRFGAQGRLFGLLCRPASQADPDLAVVITNSSGNPHYGFGRFAVELGRRLAGEGIASLRMDFAGLGDSMAPDDAETHIFETDRRGDIRSAIDLLARLGYRRFATHGLCSGAYHAFHGALADPRVSILLLINLQHFQWSEGDAAELKGYALHGPLHFLKKLGSRRVWDGFLRGRFDVFGIASMQGARLAGQIRMAGLRIAKRLGIGVEFPSFAAESMRILAPRARTLFLLSEADEGIATLSQEFGHEQVPPGATVQIVQGLDHALSAQAMRHAAIERMIAFIEESPTCERRLPRALVNVVAVQDADVREREVELKT